MQTEDLIEQLIQRTHQDERLKYVFFWGHQPKKDGSIGKTCFSQWFEASFSLNGISYLTAEHYMMAEKARLFDDQDVLNQIIASKTPALAKKLGREIRGFDEARWNERRFDAVVEGNLAQFSQHAPLKAFLLSTGDRILVEASPVDKIWGVGMAEDHPDIENPAKWQGLNLLGFALMDVRRQLLATQ
ncbi:hypothetical protein JY96_11315 [Aquabacterium sp. NJ1]|uniref:NADAR family protein n=1 Tax=Aquabacterium sp. NJ1 TaxID=1538295 RepID=UPI00052C2E44|nr:NADAR family protein [Aquabacterium sp. NJ1]KGM40428.1 hypothetical protein JY96_11315 [Aquabacterium sp. NJ1]